jgi:hypothetical protein
MALDFSKFVLPSPSADWLSKVPEYNALGIKTAAAASADKETGNFEKTLLNAVYGKPVTVKDPKAVVGGEVKQIIESGLEDIYAKAKEEISLDIPKWQVLANVKKQMSDKYAQANSVSQLGNIYEQGVEIPNKKFKGFKLENARKNFTNITQYTKDENGNIIAAPMATVIQNTNGDPTQVAAKIINPDLAPYDNWGDEDIKDVLEKANPVKTKTSFANRDASGRETGTTTESTLPSSFYEFKTNSAGESVPVPKAEEITITDDKIANAYKEVLGDYVSGNTINIVPDETFNALSNEGGNKYLEQEQAKFRRAAAKNGVDVSTPEFANELKNFSKAVLYRTVDNYSATQGYSKSKATVDKKALPMSQSSQGKKIGNEADRNATFATYTDKWTNNKDADGFIDIKDEVSGINDPNGREYRKKAAVKLGKENGKWVIKIYKRDDDGNPILDRTMDLKQFRADSKSGSDSEEKRQATHTYIDDWTTDIDNKEKSPKKSGKKKFD